MQAPDWTPAHCDALRECLTKGMSFAETAAALNSQFGTAYTRNAALGRAKRMGLRAPKRASSGASAMPRPHGPAGKAKKGPKAAPAAAAPPAPARVDPLKLRCVGIRPRLLPLVELGLCDCRYPYGGDKDGEPILFCGHARRPGSSYCTPHFNLTRGPGTASERAAGPAMLRLIVAA
jgi:GcrA cell cycle regulator